MSQPVPETDDSGWYDCQVCGRRRHSSDRCGCSGGPASVPDGWDPELTTGARTRLPLMGRPAPTERPEPAEPAEPPE